MAYVPSSETTDPNAPLQPGALAPNAPMNMPPAPMTSSGVGGTSGTPSGSGQGVSATPNAGVQPPVQNLQDYLTANQPQAAAMGQKIANNLTAGAGKVTGDIGADLSAVDQQVQASNTVPNPDLVNRAAANPSQFVTNPKDLTDFLAQENAKYTGPSSYESTPNWQRLSNEVQNAVQTAPDVTKPGGFLQLAAGQETNPTAGMTNLDAALLQETPEAAAPIMAASKPYAALQGQLTAAGSAENAAIARAKANAEASAGLIAPAFTTGPNAAVPAWEKALEAELGNAQKSVTDYNAGISPYMDERQALSDIVNQWNAYSSGVPNYGFQTTDITNPAGGPSPVNPVGPPSMASVASPQDYATEAALEKLLGGRLGTTPISGLTNEQAGTFTPPGTVPSLSPTAQQIADLISGAEKNTYDTQLHPLAMNPVFSPAYNAYNPLTQGLQAKESALFDLLKNYGAVPTYPTGQDLTTGYSYG